jgi:hypothetical protein
LPCPYRLFRKGSRAYKTASSKSFRTTGTALKLYREIITKYPAANMPTGQGRIEEIKRAAQPK